MLNNMYIWRNQNRDNTYKLFVEWSKNHDYVIQVSHPRSGRHWLEALLKRK